MFVIGVIAACLAAVAYGMSTVLRALGARRVAQEAREEGNEAGQTNASGGPSISRRCRRSSTRRSSSAR